jgi:hypothetical protein
MPSIRWLLLLPAIAAFATACGPIRSTAGMVDARAAIRAAEDVGADSVALYEMTLAREYLDKAREEMGYNDYFVAEQLSIKAMELALAAREKAVGDELLLEDDETTSPVMEDPDLDELPDIGELSPQRRSGAKEDEDDLLAPDPWEEEAAPPAPAEPAAPLTPTSDPWTLDMPPPTATPAAVPSPAPAEGTAPVEGTPPAEEDAPPAEEEEEEEEEEDSGDLLMPDWLDEEEP